MLGLVLGGWCAVATARAAGPADDFRQANQLYDAGQFATAAATYERIEPKTAAVYFNLGNAWFREGKLGTAILNYERARRLAPRDPDVLANLRFAEQRAAVEEINAAPQAVRRFIQRALASRTTIAWARHEIAGLWLMVLAVAGWVWVPKLRSGCLVLAVMGLGWFAGAAAALGSRAYEQRRRPPAIVLAAKAEVRFAPLPDATVHFQAVEGTRVAVREDRGQWLLVERADGQEGWIRAEAVERVLPR